MGMFGSKEPVCTCTPFAHNGLPHLEKKQYVPSLYDEHMITFFADLFYKLAP